jgi:AcrR family transcriptional regulator
MQAKRLPRTNQERSDATRDSLLNAARKLFIERGYAETSTPDIVAAAGITRGALYHHFEDKRALFRAVVEAEGSAVADEIERSTGIAAAPLASLLAGTDAYLEAMTVRGRTRLLLIDGPAALGIAAMQEIDAATSAQTLHDALDAVMKPPKSVSLDHLTALLSAAFDRAALEIDAGADRRAVTAAMKLILTKVVSAK